MHLHRKRLNKIMYRIKWLEGHISVAWRCNVFFFGCFISPHSENTVPEL